MLPNFDPEWGDTADYHIRSFFLSLCKSGVADEDVVCHMFSFTLTSATYTWYFSLRIGSITFWDAFQQFFLDKFGDEKTPAALVLELSHLKMETKEKLKDFNIWFNRIPATARPTEEVLMEFDITALTNVMWVKRTNAWTLQGVIDEVVKVKNEMLSLTTCHPTIGENKASQTSKKNNGNDKKVDETKEKDTIDVEGLHRIINKLMNIVIDMKKNHGESTSGNGGDYNNRKPFKPFYHKKTEGDQGQLALSTPPNEGALNMEEMALIGLLLNKEEHVVELEP